MSSDAKTTKTGGKLSEEINKMEYEPILPVEKQLIGWSLALGTGLLVFLYWLSVTFFPSGTKNRARSIAPGRDQRNCIPRCGSCIEGQPGPRPLPFRRERVGAHAVRLRIRSGKTGISPTIGRHRFHSPHLHVDALD